MKSTAAVWTDTRHMRSKSFFNALLGLVCIAFLPSPAVANSKQENDALFQRVMESSRWIDFVEQVKVNSISVVDAGQFRSLCRDITEKSLTTDKDEIVVNCMKSVIENLDNSSSFLTPAEHKNFTASDSNRFVGIGLELRPHGEGYVEIVSTVQGSPAEKAGLKPGDLIVSVDGVLAKTLPFEDFVMRMRGEAGSSMTLLIARNDTATPMTFVVNRQKIVPRTVKSQLISSGVGYLRIGHFRDQTRSELLEDISKLESDNSKPLATLIVDLRNCPGGLLDAVVGTAAAFIPVGASVLQVAGRQGEPSKLYRALPADYESKVKPSQEEKGLPGPSSPLKATIIVLVNGRTASGAEALAYVLKEGRKATLMGERTNGQGIVQTYVPIPPDAGMRIASGIMLTPGGHSWDGQGIEPDVHLGVDGDTPYEFGDMSKDKVLVQTIQLLDKYR